MALAKGAEGGAEWKDATDSTGSPPPAPSRTSLGTPRTRLVTGATRNPLHDLFGGVRLTTRSGRSFSSGAWPHHSSPGATTTAPTARRGSPPTPGTSPQRTHLRSRRTGRWRLRSADSAPRDASWSRRAVELPAERSRGRDRPYARTLRRRPRLRRLPSCAGPQRERLGGRPGWLLVRSDRPRRAPAGRPLTTRRRWPARSGAEGRGAPLRRATEE